MKNNTQKLTMTGILIAMGLVLPLLMHMIAVGSVMLPMHIPVLICGLLCGAPYGAACGFILPFLSSAVTGMPPLFPTAIAMSLELCAYGAMTGLLYRGKTWNVYPAMITAMLAGRAIAGLANAVLIGMSGGTYSLQIFLTASFVTGLPGIAVQIALIPLIVMSLEKTKIIIKPKRQAGTAL